MPLTWYPDFCVGQPCAIEIERDWSAPRRFVRRCAHHQSLGLPDQALFDAILQSSRVKEAARWAVKVELGLNKEHPGVRYRTNADGSFTVLTDAASLAWTREDGTAGPLPTIRNQDRTRARTAALNAALTVSRPAGTSTVTVE